ncbi:tricarboxylate transporter [Cryptococcus neoformans 125.91]|nr:tricarboxylate transporter [Cryptococcus neoformans var. grubii 125.91]
MTSGVTKGNNDHHHEQQQEAAPVGLASPGWCQRWYVRVLYHLCE